MRAALLAEWGITDDKDAPIVSRFTLNEDILNVCLFDEPAKAIG